jgi:hypothetical protein
MPNSGFCTQENIKCNKTKEDDGKRSSTTTHRYAAVVLVVNPSKGLFFLFSSAVLLPLEPSAEHK